FNFPKQFGRPMISTPNGWKKIKDWFLYAEGIPTIEEELKNLVKPSNMENAIYIIHAPPSNLKLDVCHDGRTVGSEAVYRFLEKYQPFMSFHGHIHECPEVSGKWYNYLGRTLCIQPGQSHHHENYLVYAIINIKNTSDISLERKVVNKNE
ncbi:MAG: hypothetical protein ACFFAO_11640, partial [Candidatus Hermodarchaeota archaeon]